MIIILLIIRCWEWIPVFYHMGGQLTIGFFI